VAERADGLAVREDDAEPELLDDEGALLADGDVVAMAVKVSGYPAVFKPYPTSTPFLTFAFHCLICWNSITRNHRWCGGHLLRIGLRWTKGRQWRDRVHIVRILLRPLAPS
jgi:hypothetical protein